MKRIVIISSLFMLLFGCEKSIKFDNEVKHEETEFLSNELKNGTINLDEPVFISYDWSMVQGQKYKYVPTAIEENGIRYLFYCTNIESGNITDHIALRIGEFVNGSWQYGQEQVVLWPGVAMNPGDYIWDQRHVCDPEVIAGEFWYQRPQQSEKEMYSYALFYLGIADELVAHGGTGVNQIGWAVAKQPEGPWYKVVGNGPLLTSIAGYWGVGQPSVTSIDGKGELLLFYTRGENVTATYRQHIDLSDANNPVVYDEKELLLDGLTRSDGSPEYLNHGGAFMYDHEMDGFYIIRNGHPNPTDYPDWISSHLQVAYIPANDVWTGIGEWTVLTNLENEAYDRIFDGGWVRNKYGGVLSSYNLESLISTADAGTSSLWSYRIHSYTLPK
jgi:hypothetical protein